MRLFFSWVFAAALCVSALAGGGAPLQAQTQPDEKIKPAALVASARAQIGVTTSYDPAYQILSYPNGDVPRDRGVCTDVLIRALRYQGCDLQSLVHEDMAAHFRSYPQIWSLKQPDKNIDHRRVPNLATFFTRCGSRIPASSNPAEYLPGDVVTWNLAVNLPHVGIVSDRKSADGTPLILHNIGNGAQEEDILFSYKITGHFRLARLSLK